MPASSVGRAGWGGSAQWGGGGWLSVSGRHGTRHPPLIPYHSTASTAAAKWLCCPHGRLARPRPRLFINATRSPPLFVAHALLFRPLRKGASGHGRPQALQGRRVSAPAASFTAFSAAASSDPLAGIAESDAAAITAAEAASDGAFFTVAVSAAAAAVGAQLKGADADSQSSARFLKLEAQIQEREAAEALSAAQIQELKALTAQLKAEAAAHRELTAQAGLQRVRNAATEILSMVIEGIKRYTPPSKGAFDRADHLLGDPTFVSFGEAAFRGLSKEAYVAKMVAMYTRRNTSAHFSSVAALREEVAILKAHYLTAEMRALAKDECVVIDEFEAAVKIASDRPLQPPPASGRTPSPAQARKKSKKRKQ